MPELGKYAVEVLSSYAVSIALLAVLVGLSLWRSRRVRAQLEEVEERVRRDGQD
ncbi:heme exporter protein CcmD [Roseovarius salinarum]|uniref:heme exporter protein CcmD n=1 Tax=Roseovarius salinarum TaxID=1981892 RepID=UPI000C33B58F|nr:heme exporter protein CcmD [Roseovarius salinarum]